MEVISAHILEYPSIVEAPKKEVLEQSKLSIAFNMLNKAKNIETRYVSMANARPEERMDQDLNYYTLYQETFEAVTWR